MLQFLIQVIALLLINANLAFFLLTLKESIYFLLLISSDTKSNSCSTFLLCKSIFLKSSIALACYLRLLNCSITQVIQCRSQQLPLLHQLSCLHDNSMILMMTLISSITSYLMKLENYHPFHPLLFRDKVIIAIASYSSLLHRPGLQHCTILPNLSCLLRLLLAKNEEFDPWEWGSPPSLWAACKSNMAMNRKNQEKCLCPFDQIGPISNISKKIPASWSPIAIYRSLHLAWEFDQSWDQVPPIGHHLGAYMKACILWNHWN